MLYVVCCLDRPDVLEKRKAHIAAHREYLGGIPINFLLSGSLMQESDHKTMKGSFFLVDAENRA